MMEKIEILSSKNRPNDFPDHCEFELLLALQLRSFQVKYPITDDEMDTLLENIYHPIFNSAIEAYAYFENNERLSKSKGWSINKARLKANIGENFFGPWKEFSSEANTVIFVDKKNFKFEDFFKNCIDPFVLGNPGSIYLRSAWNFGRKKAARENLIGFFIDRTNFEEIRDDKSELISIIGSGEKIKKVYKLAIQYSKVSNIYVHQRKMLKPARVFKILFDKKTCKLKGKGLNDGYGSKIWGTIRGNFHKKGYGELADSTVNDDGNYLNIAIYTNHLEEGLLSIKQILKKKLFAPENTIIKEYTWPDTRYNYSFRLDEEWVFHNSKSIY